MPSENHYPAEHAISTTVTIANGGTASTAVQLFGNAKIWNVAAKAFILPAAFTGTSVSIQASLDGSTWVGLYDENNAALSFTVTQGRAYRMIADDFAGWPYLRFVSNGAEAAERTITVLQYIV
jgi:hypothetical protein